MFKPRIAFSCIICLGSAWLMGCLPEPLDVKGISPPEPKVVVSSQMLAGQGIAVLLTKTIGALESGEDSTDFLDRLLLNDAVVVMSGNGWADTLVFQGYGLYTAAFDAWEEGSEYRLDIWGDDVGYAHAKAILPQRIGFEQVNVRAYISPYDTIAEVSFAISDPTDQNYYMVNLQPISQEMTFESLFNPRLFTYLLPDSIGNGMVLRDTFKVFFQGYNIGDTVLVSMSNISPEYYNYLQLRLNDRYNFNDFGTEPINFPTNVDNGYGFFNLHVPDFRVFILE